MLDTDRSGAVDQRVDEREPQHVCLGPREEPTGDPRLGLGEAHVGVPPAGARCGREADVTELACGPKVCTEALGHVGAFERVGVATVGEQAGSGAGDGAEPVQQAGSTGWTRHVRRP